MVSPGDSVTHLALVPKGEGQNGVCSGSEYQTVAMTLMSELCGWAEARLRLCFDEALRPDGGSLVVSSLAGPLSVGHKEPAGIVFHTKVLQQSGNFVYPDDEEEDSQASSGADAKGLPSSVSSASLDTDQPPPGVNWKGSKKKKSKKKEGQDLYALLGLANERWTANETQIKNAYRKVCLEHHPDKKLAGVTDDSQKTKIEDYFKQIQEAYGVLSDPVKRREYDSVDEFDDSLPLECAAADFYKVFGPAFRRNARWSSADGAVPDLGDEAAAWEDVERFYNFWFTFKSWREFPHPDEEDAEGAESREHRRWIDRQNAKLREKGKKEEGRRLREFVDAAYRLDPRVVARKEEERAERERRKAEKEEARRKAEEAEAAKKAEEEAARKAEEEAAKKAAEEAKKLREATKKAHKKERQRLRLISEGGEGFARLADEDDIEKLCSSLTLEKLQALCDSLYAPCLSREQQQQLVQAALGELLGAAAAEAAAKEAQRKEAEANLKSMTQKSHAKKMEAMREWNDEELRLLDKAVSKFPQGTPKRWEAVAAYIRTRTLDEVLLMVKEKQGMSATRVKAQEDFRSGMKKRAEVQSQADLRMNAFTDVNVNLAGAAASKLMAAPGLTAEASQDSTTTKAGLKATSGSSASLVSQAGSENGSVASSVAGSVASSAQGEGGKKKAADSGAWSEEQELALVKALKEVSKDLGAERWERVAELVPGKTKAQCFKRFKELREAFRAKKGGAGGKDDDGDE